MYFDTMTLRRAIIRGAVSFTVPMFDNTMTLMPATRHAFSLLSF